jgi:hypothetical protein
MCRSKDGRTTTERKYQPIRREVSRYGKLEKILNDMKDKGAKIDCRVIAWRIKMWNPMQVSKMLRFTNGVAHGDKKGTWVFTGEPIHVDNSTGGTKC